MSEISLIAAGDSFITRDISELPQIRNISKIMKSCDVVFTNLETTLMNEGCGRIPAARSGGFWSQASSEVLRTLKFLGINLVSLANNHTMDYSVDGLSETRACLRDAGLTNSGAGYSLGDASAPSYLQAGQHRVSLISLTSTFHEENRAGEQDSFNLGRPGINPLRVRTIHKITSRQLKVLQEIAKQTDINALLDYSQKKGNLIEDDPGSVFYFGDYDFMSASLAGTSYELNSADLRRTLDTIEDARLQSDLVIISVHCHEMIREDSGCPPEFLQEFARKCLSAGAHVFLGHGPHFMRGIEIFDQRPIFYGLGNFIFQNYTVSSQPKEMYDLLGLSPHLGVSAIVEKLCAGGKSGILGNPEYTESVLPTCTFSNGRIKDISLHPIQLSGEGPVHSLGVPALSQSHRVLERLQDLSRPFGTRIDMNSSKVLI